MKESGNIIRSAVKVKIINLNISTIFNALIGKLFWSDWNKYEGELKDYNFHGQGRKREKLIMSLLNTF